MMDSKTLASNLTPASAKRLYRECRREYGDGFEIRSGEHGGLELWGPTFAQDFVDGFIAGAQPPSLPSPPKSGEYPSSQPPDAESAEPDGDRQALSRR